LDLRNSSRKKNKSKNKNKEERGREREEVERVIFCFLFFLYLQATIIIRLFQRLSLAVTLPNQQMSSVFRIPAAASGFKANNNRIFKKNNGNNEERRKRNDHLKQPQSYDRNVQQYQPHPHTSKIQEEHRTDGGELQWVSLHCGRCGKFLVEPEYIWAVYTVRGSGVWVLQVKRRSVKELNFRGGENTILERE